MVGLSKLPVLIAAGLVCRLAILAGAQQAVRQILALGAELLVQVRKVGASTSRHDWCHPEFCKLCLAAFKIPSFGKLGICCCGRAAVRVKQSWLNMRILQHGRVKDKHVMCWRKVGCLHVSSQRFPKPHP